MKPVRVALASIGHCPSLATRNLRRYCLGDPGLASSCSFSLYDYHLEAFRQERLQTALQWSFATELDRAAGEILTGEPDLVAFSCYLWNTEVSVRLAEALVALRPGLRIVLGGPDAGPRAAELLRRHSAIDVIVEGDGEVPLHAMLGKLTGDSGDWRDAPGARYLDGEQLRANPPARDVDLTRLDGVVDEVPELLLHPERPWPWPYVLYETLRGCPYSCSYCMYGKTPMNAKDEDLAVDELHALMRQGLVVNIIDPTFTTYKKRAKRILGALAERDYSGGLYFEAYPDSIDDEMADLMALARVRCVGLGFQTISSEGLRAVSRPKNLERFERAVERLRDRGVTHYVDIIYGLPATTIDDFFATVDYLYDQNVETIVMYRLLGLPGSPMLDDRERYNLRFSPSPPYELLASDTYSHADLMRCEQFQRAYRELTRKLRGGLRPLAARAGGASHVVRRYLDSAGADVEALLAFFEQPAPPAPSSGQEAAQLAAESNPQNRP